MTIVCEWRVSSLSLTRAFSIGGQVRGRGNFCSIRPKRAGALRRLLSEDRPVTHVRSPMAEAAGKRHDALGLLAVIDREVDQNEKQYRTERVALSMWR